MHLTAKLTTCTTRPLTPKPFTTRATRRTLPARSLQAAWAQASVSDQQGIGQSEEVFIPLTKARKKAKQAGLAVPRNRLALVGTAAGCAALAVGAGAAITALALDASQMAVASAALAAGNCLSYFACVHKLSACHRILSMIDICTWTSAITRHHAALSSKVVQPPSCCCCIAALHPSFLRLLQLALYVPLHSNMLPVWLTRNSCHYIHYMLSNATSMSLHGSCSMTSSLRSGLLPALLNCALLMVKCSCGTSLCICQSFAHTELHLSMLRVLQGLLCCQLLVGVPAEDSHAQAQVRGRCTFIVPVVCA